MIVLVVALTAEARPVRAFFHMQRKSEHHDYPWYETKDLVLIQSGPGKTSAAAAVHYAAERLSTVTGFVNFGICGHSNLDIGTLLQASKIIDQTSRQHWNLQSTSQPSITSSKLLTVNIPLETYPENCAIDMEASGFYSTASTLVSPRQIACLKVVSDNPDHHWKKIDKTIIVQLLTNHLDCLASILNDLMDENG